MLPEGGATQPLAQAPTPVPEAASSKRPLARLASRRGHARGKGHTHHKELVPDLGPFPQSGPELLHQRDVCGDDDLLLPATQTRRRSVSAVPPDRWPACCSLTAPASLHRRLLQVDVRSRKDALKHQLISAHSPGHVPVVDQRAEVLPSGICYAARSLGTSLRTRREPVNGDGGAEEPLLEPHLPSSFSRMCTASPTCRRSSCSPLGL